MKINLTGQVCKNIFLSVLSGLLGVLAFPPFEFSFLGWLCIVPLLTAVKGETSGRSFLYGFLSGIVFFSGLMYWLVNVTYPGTFILVIILSFFFGIFGYISNFVIKNSIDIFVLPFFWIVLEYIRSYLFTGFPWGLLGYSQYQKIVLIQIADFMGPYGVSFILMFFNVTLFSFLNRIKKYRQHMLMTFILLFLTISYGVYRIENNSVWNSLRVSVVQGNIEQRYKWDENFAEEIVNKYTSLTNEVISADPDLIIWPETSYPYLVQDISADLREIKDIAKRDEVYILTGFVFDRGDGFYNSAALVDKNGKLEQTYNKIHLVPFGEYVPFEHLLSFLRRFVDKPIGQFDKGQDFVLFKNESLKVSELPGGGISRKNSFHKFGVLICFEDIFPYMARNFVKKGADFLVNITNDAWFGKTPGARQHLQSSVFRAVENRVPLIRAANTGISCFISSRGKISAIVSDGRDEIFISGTVTADMNLGRRGSFYTFYGDVFVFFSIFIIVFFMIRWNFVPYVKKRFLNK